MALNVFIHKSSQRGRCMLGWLCLSQQLLTLCCIVLVHKVFTVLYTVSFVLLFMNALPGSIIASRVRSLH